MTISQRKRNEDDIIALEKIDDSLRSMSMSFDKIAFATDFSTFIPSMIYLPTLFFRYSHFGDFSFDIFSFGVFISNQKVSCNRISSHRCDTTLSFATEL